MENQVQNSENQQNQKEDSGKIEKNYQNVFQKLVAIVGGEQNLRPTKRVKRDVLSKVVEGLLKDQREKAEADIKDGLSKLLDKHVQLQKAIAEKEKEFNKLKEDKKKEFTQEANNLFGKLADLDQLEADYKTALGAATPENK